MNAGDSRAPIAMVNTTRFRGAHQGDWERLESIISRLECKSIAALDDDELIALPVLYRTTLSSLAMARASSLDRALTTYLEQLCTRAYFQIYGVQTPARRQIAEFFRVGWPNAVRALWRETLLCWGLMALATLAGFLLVRDDPQWFYSMVPQAMAGGRDPAASAADLRATLYDGGDKWLATFAASLFANNSQVAILAFALGFAFAVPTILLILYNGLLLGAMLSVFAAKGLSGNFAAWLVIHGTTELFAIALAGAAGIRIGMSLAFPGRLSRTDALVRSGRVGATAMIGVVIMLAIAGLLEGIGRQTVNTDSARIIIGTAMLGGWIAYFYVIGGRRSIDG